MGVLILAVGALAWTVRVLVLGYAVYAWIYNSEGLGDHYEVIQDEQDRFERF